MWGGSPSSAAGLVSTHSCFLDLIDHFLTKNERVLFLFILCLLHERLLEFYNIFDMWFQLHHAGGKWSCECYHATWYILESQKDYTFSNVHTSACNLSSKLAFVLSSVKILNVLKASYGISNTVLLTWFREYL